MTKVHPMAHQHHAVFLDLSNEDLLVVFKIRVNLIYLSLSVWLSRINSNKNEWAFAQYYNFLSFTSILVLVIFSFQKNNVCVTLKRNINLVQSSVFITVRTQE